MTAQHLPHTPPLWRQVLSLPHTRLGWWATGLLGVSVLLYTWAMLFLGGPMPNVHAYVPGWLDWAVTGVAIILGILFLFVPVASGVVSSLALAAGERSILVWLAQVPTVLFMIVLVTAFEQRNADVRAPVAIGVWVLVALALYFTARRAQRR